MKETGGVKHVPPGWEQWHALVGPPTHKRQHLHVPLRLQVFALRSQVGNSQYYNYSLSVNGEEEKHGDSYEADYLTDLIVSREPSSRPARHPRGISR